MSLTFSVPPVWDVVGDYSNNPTYRVGSTLGVEWSTSFDHYQVYFWQQNLQQGSAKVSDPIFVKMAGTNEPGGFAWTIGLMSFDLSASNVFFMAQGPNETLAGAFLSHYFNLTTSALQTTSAATTSRSKTTATSSASSPATTGTSTGQQTGATAGTTGIGATGTATGTTSALSATVTVTRSSPSASSSPISDPGTGSDNVGLFLGPALGLGIPMILLLAFLAFKMRQRKAPRVAPSPSGMEVANSQIAGYTLPPKDRKYVYVPSPVELDHGREVGRGFAGEAYQNRPYLWSTPVELPTSRSSIAQPR